MKPYTFLSLFLMLWVGGCANAQEFHQPLTFHEVTDRLLRPWDMAFVSEHQALVTEKEGGLQLVDLTNGSKRLITGLPDDLASRNQSGLGDNSGLFSVRLAPGFTDNRRLYLSYAAKNIKGLTTTKVVSATLEKHALKEIKSIFVAEPYSSDRYHYGGGLLVGKDHHLYLTVGERLFNEKDQPDLPIAQDTGDLRGKIYRFPLTPGRKKPASPIKEAGHANMIALGIRAAQGMTQNPLTRTIWFSEHGTRQGDELNVLKPGRNYGWPVKTDGGYRFQAYAPPSLADREFHAPDWSWPTTVAPTGLTFYTGDIFPQWRGDLLVAGLSRGSLWHMEVDGDRITKANLVMTGVRLRNVKQSPNGILYLLTDEANGRLIRLDAPD